MNIVFVHTHMFHHQTWKRVADRLESEGIRLSIFPQQNAPLVLDMLAAGDTDLFLGELSQGLPAFKELTAAAEQARHRIGFGMEMPKGFSTLSEDVLSLFKSYIAKVSEENYYNGIKYLASQAGMDTAYEAVQPVKTHGIYHCDAPETFGDTASYLNWHEKHRGVSSDGNIVGMLCYHSQIVEGNTVEIDEVIHSLEDHGLVPLCVFCEGIPDSSLLPDRRYPWLSYFKTNGSHPEAVLNLLGGRFLARQQDVRHLQGLDVPVYQLIRNYTQTAEQWLEDPVGLSGHSLVYSVAQPEVAGIIEPTLVAALATEVSPADPASSRPFTPIEERIDTLCRRLKRLIRLRRLPNFQKRITFVLHNNPCKGVEATVGMATGLDAFQSLASVLQAMKSAGYDTGDAPANGKEILEMILQRKAVSEFRWTTVSEIVQKGGVLYRMGREEYETYLDSLPSEARERVLSEWGGFPGQGMVYREDGRDVLLITGLRFGKIKIMPQPKRGCYGSKCNGEVCRILHDPELPPPHHWLATYKYIRDTSDAVVHFGTGGSLEYLPGKRAALSERCFPALSVDDLPHIYLYVMNVPGEGLMAKRRAGAVMVDHLTPVYRPAEMDEETRRLEALLEQYFRASDMGEAARLDLIGKEMLPLMKRLKFVEKDDGGEDLQEKARLASRQIELTKRALAPDGMHILGTFPDATGRARMLTTILLHPSPELPDLQGITQKLEGGTGNVFEDGVEITQSILENLKPERLPDELLTRESFNGLADWCRNMDWQIRESRREIPQLLKALNGGYIEPGLSGSIYQGKTDALPTGRNFFATDVTMLPTRAAWEIGCKLADRLLSKFLDEEGRFPENIGINLWSSDAFKSDGEVCSQILYLLGVRPVWNAYGRVGKVEAIPLEELEIRVAGEKIVRRPRIDVTIQASGILRDMVMNFCELLDDAVLLVSRLDEPGEWNFIRKHTLEHMDALRSEMQDRLSESQIRRLASFRVFSSAPGTYGLGVGLALDASAWEDDKDLAEVYVNWGGYAYGSNKNAEGLKVYGMEVQDLLARQLSNIDVSFMKQSTAEYDILDCGCYAVFQGGMAAASRALGGKGPKLYWGDANQADTPDIRDFKEEIGRSARARLLNRKWIENMKRHGYQGAQDVSSRVNNLFKWSATSREVEKWVFDSVVESYILDRENLEWLREANPHALEELTRRLLEAHSRGLWEADPELLAEVQSAALTIEGDMEEMMGDVEGEFQGGKVEMLTSRNVEKWEPKWTFKKP
ncbi:MAG: cobaltochelatase subunit CobN [Deltaproteobacteria bacterium]|nr:cobaltochelatase subunit CobN [Deltaproteobacteria bacterium]